MDETMLEFIKQQTEALRVMAEKIGQTTATDSTRVPLPSALNVEKGDVLQNFEYFIRSWSNYCIASGVDKWPNSENSKKTHLFLTALGEKALIKYNQFNLTEEDKKDCDKVIEIIKKNLGGEKNVIYLRALFNSANQADYEAFEEYLVRLQTLIEPCEYKDFQNDLLRDRIVLGIRNRDIRKKLMLKGDLTLAQAIDICKVDEITSQRLKNLEHNEPSSINKLVNKDKNKSCLFCGNKHKFIKGMCPAYGKTCAICKGKNHFAKVCKKKKEYDINPKKYKKVKEIRNDNSSSEEEQQDRNSTEVEIKRILDHSSKGGSVRAELFFEVNNRFTKLLCDLDTGANVSLIGRKQLNALLKTKDVNLSRSKHILYGFGGNKINVIGEKKLTCKHKGVDYEINFQVVDVNHGPLLSAQECKKLGLVKFCNSVIDDRSQVEKTCDDLIQEANNLIDNYKDVFQGNGCFKEPVSLEIDKEIKPSIQKARRIPINLREKLKKELDKLEKQSIIEKVDRHTEWVSNILLVERNDSLRICLDPIPLNKALQRPNSQFTTIDEILPELGKAKVFSTMDAKKGFWQIQLDNESSYLTTFWTPYGRYKWLRMPFGIAPAPEIFQSRMQEILVDLEGIEILADDILVIGRGDTEQEALLDHNQNLEHLLIRLREANCKLNRAKLNLCKKSVKFYGHILTDEGLKADKNKIEAITQFPIPKNKKDLHRFLGMITYLSRYIKNLSSNTHNLRKLLKDNVEWTWNESQMQEFNNVKNMIINASSLNYFNKNKSLTIECDASNYGLGAAVYQEDRIIGFASRTLTKTEQNYAQIEKELLAIVFACIRFNQLILGNSTTIIKTDHRPLITIFGKPLLSIPKRLQKMLMTLQRYNIKLDFVSGKENVIADALSRAPINSNLESYDIKLSTVYQTTEKKICKYLETVDLSKQVSISEERMEEIKEKTKHDYCLQAIKNYIMTGWPNTIHQLPDEVKRYNPYKYELTYQNGIIHRNDRIVIPFTLRKKILDKLHTSHNGLEATINLAKRNVFWPGMTCEIKNKIKECATCIKYSESQCKLPMQTHVIPEFPFQYISMDILTTDYMEKKTYFLVTVDHYSDYFELDILKNLSSRRLIETCKLNFSRHGIPQRICTDNGTNFVSTEFQRFVRQWDICHITSSPHYPQSNGKAESAVKIAKKLIKKTENNNEDLWLGLLHLRNIPNHIGTSPVQRLFSRATRTLIPSATINYLPEIIKNVPESIDMNKRKAKQYYDKRSRHLPQLEIGQPVAAQIHPEKSNLWTSGRIEEKLSDRSYVVNADGHKYRRSLVQIKPIPEVINEEAKTNPVSPVKHTQEDSQSTQDREQRESESKEEQKEYLKISKPNATSNNPVEDVQHVKEDVQRPKRSIKVPIKFKDYVIK